MRRRTRTRRWAKRATECVDDHVTTLHWMAFKGLGVISHVEFTCWTIYHDMALNMHSWIRSTQSCIHIFASQPIELAKLVFVLS